MKKVHNISHIDLDGYTCTYLVNKVYRSDKDTQLVQTNVDYDELTEHLNRVLSSYSAEEPLSELVITDLNLKAKDVSIILAHQGVFDRLVLLDHHQNDLDQIERLTDEIPTTIVINPAKSASLLTYEHYRDRLEELDALVDMTNTYDLYLVEKDLVFNLAYLINQTFMEFMVQVKSLLVYGGVREVSNQFFDYLDGWLDEEVYSLDRPKIYVANRLNNFFGPSAVGGMCDVGLLTEDQRDHLLEVMKDTPVQTRKAMLLAALAVGPKGGVGGVIHDTDKGRVLTCKQPLNRDALFHLMYTMDVIDSYIVMQKPDLGKVEFRQHKLKPLVNMSAIAGEHGGGGHIGAAGCYMKGDWYKFIIRALTHFD